VPSSLHSTAAKTQGERRCHQLNIVGALTDVSRTSLGMPYDATVNSGSFHGMLIDAGVVSISKVDQLLTTDIILLITQRDISVELLTRLTVVIYGSYDRDFLEIDAFLRIVQELQLYPVSTVMVLKSFWAKVLSFTEKQRVPSVKIMKLFLSLLAAILNKVVAIASNTTNQLAPLLYERALREALDSSDHILKAVSEMVSEWDYSVHEDRQAQLKNVKIEFAKFQVDSNRNITGACCVEGDCKFCHAYPPGLKAVEKRAYKLAAGLREDARAAPSVASTSNRGAARPPTPARAASLTAAAPAVAIP
jgi:hypothetical protein